MVAPELNPSRGRFLHIIQDDKFIDAAHDIFEEVAPGANDYLLLSTKQGLRYIRSFKPVRVDSAFAADPFFSKEFVKYDAVFIHYLNNAARLLINSIPSQTKLIWLAWGADYYHLLCTEGDLLLPRTRAVLAEARASRMKKAGALLLSSATGAVAPLRSWKRFRIKRRIREIGASAPGESALLQKFTAVSMPIVEDHQALCAQHPELRIPFLDWNYWTEDFFTSNLPERPTGNNILLGNSASPTNNHMEMLELLAESLHMDRKVFCPLSYGIPRYGDVIERKGRELLGERFVPLRTYMDSEAYAKVISSCSVVVMNHIRQQALGNIVIALCSGSRVFLNPLNPVLGSLRNLGITPNEVGELPQFLGSEYCRTQQPRLSLVRERIESRYGRPSILKRTHIMLRKLEGENHSDWSQGDS